MIYNGWTTPFSSVEQTKYGILGPVMNCVNIPGIYKLLLLLKPRGDNQSVVLPEKFSFTIKLGLLTGYSVNNKGKMSTSLFVSLYNDEPSPSRFSLQV